MMRLTGTVLFSLMCLLPLKVEGASGKKLQICPAGKVPCPRCGGCANRPEDCTCVLVPLKNKEGIIYSLEEGGVVKCEGDRPLLPITIGTETLWTCETVEKK